LFQQDGTTPIPSGSFITVAQGSAGLRFTPALNSAVTGTVSVQASTSNADAGLGGGIATGSIFVGGGASTLTLGASGSPSNPGQTVTFTATISPSFGGASGTVTFMDGAQALGAPVPVANAKAVLATSALASGTHQISASFSGNDLVNGSNAVLAGGQVVR